LEGVAGIMTTVTFVASLRSMHIEEGYTPVGFVRIPPETAEAIVAHAFERRLELGKRRGFGSVKVTVALGESRWQTSLFPNKDGSWFLPVKKAVRVAEGLMDGDEVAVELELH
jgi:hypothetical protein